MKLEIPSQRGQSITVYGGLYFKTGTLICTREAKTDTLSAVSFFEHIHSVQSRFDSAANTVIVLDGHTSHYTERLTSTLTQWGYSILYLPPVSSPLNPIETCWALLKRLLADRIYDNAGTIRNR